MIRTIAKCKGMTNEEFEAHLHQADEQFGLDNTVLYPHLQQLQLQPLENYTDGYEVNESLKVTKTNLTKIIRWSNSRKNTWKKSEVVDLILEAIGNRNEGIQYFRCETESEEGISYKLLIDTNRMILVYNEDASDQYVYELNVT